MVDEAQRARPHVIDGRLVALQTKSFTAPAPNLSFLIRLRRFIAVTKKLSFGGCFAFPADNTGSVITFFATKRNPHLGYDF